MLEGKNNWKAWLYLLPVLLLLGLFSFYPIINTFVIAFVRDYYPVASTFAENVAENEANGLSFFTLDNFKYVLEYDYFWPSIKNTLLIAFVSVPISLFLSLFVSVLLVSVEKLRGFFQTLFFLPYVTSAMAVSMAFIVLFVNPVTKDGYGAGPVNTVIEAVGLKDVVTDYFDLRYWQTEGKEAWEAYICADPDTLEQTEEQKEKLHAKYENEMATYDFMGIERPYTEEDYFEILVNDTEQKENLEHRFRKLGRIDWTGAQSTYQTCIFIVILYSIWGGMAFKILVFTGGLTGIDKQYYDAAKIDGTSKWRTFWRITVPMISPLIVYLLTTSFIGSFKTYTSVVGLFGEKMGPSGHAWEMVTFVGIIYFFINEGGSNLIHVASAASIVLFVIIFVITKILNLITEKKVHY